MNINFDSDSIAIANKKDEHDNKGGHTPVEVVQDGGTRVRSGEDVIIQDGRDDIRNGRDVDVDGVDSILSN